MNRTAALQTANAKPHSSSGHGILLQRKCACGGAVGLSGQCEGCGKKRMLGIQTMLAISEPGDTYEQEADRVADQVMRMQEPETGRVLPHEDTGKIVRTGKISKQIMPLIQRQMPEEEKPGEAKDAIEDEELTEEEIEELEKSNVAPIAQRKADFSPAAVTNDGQEALQGALGRRDAGTALNAEIRDFMESRFGHDFSRVRIHTDERAQNAARAIRSRAFTVSQNIWFARGAFSPNTSSGRHLLAHELTHILQQRGHPDPDSYSTIQRSICPSACETPVAAGNLCKAEKVTRDNCAERDAEDPDNKISHIRVVLADRKVTLFWNGTPRTADGTSEEIGCTPNAGKTPAGWDTVGKKCGENHTSYKKYNMAWFTAFKNTGMLIGFHDSQPLGSGFKSAGCVRVSCEDAEKINKHSKSDWTSIIVR